ncbi:hypothetical protein ERJ77_17730 [Vibrio anguillarum]|uniref:Uncharacterized protein n=1 Tax=Vibrio anguillarum TaxID=55601 RepID=A0AAW4BGY1_VIBAN|nr:hypothetical protein [Vibrio anguillarum]NNN70861.1 hypothetical protein [Vibrio sp. 3-2(1)]
MGLCDYGCYFEFSVLRCQPLNRALCFRDNLRKRDGFHLVGFSFWRGCNILLFCIIFEATG